MQSRGKGYDNAIVDSDENDGEWQGNVVEYTAKGREPGHPC